MLNISNLLRFGKLLYWLVLIVLCIPFELVNGFELFRITPPVALFLGLIFATVFGIPHPGFNKKISKYLLQVSVVGLGFGMNLHESLRSGAEGMMFTIISVVLVMFVGIILGKHFKIDSKTSYLISSGTAICGGSAIAAVGGVLKANENQMAVSLGVVFVLNAIALFLFPWIGNLFGMSQEQFGTWAAIAIHDTSSVVGAGEAYGAKACEVATLVKCTRALWIIPLSLFTIFWYSRNMKSEAMASGSLSKARINIPWFILFFVLAMIVSTYTPDSLSVKQNLYPLIVAFAKRALVIVLFAIGAGLSWQRIKRVGFKPFVHAFLLWVIIGFASLLIVYYTI